MTQHSLLAPPDKRIKRRRRAETRLRFYGLSAIVLAITALVALLGSVISQASNAVTETYVTLPVELSAKRIDPDGTGDPAVILRGKFDKLTKSALKEAFPTIKGRSAKRALYDVVSGGASFELAQHVADAPDLVGETISYRFLASDVSDLYLKGAYGHLRTEPVSGDLSIVKDGKEVVLSSTAPDFASALQTVKSGLVTEARKLREQAALQNNGVRVFQERAQSAVTDADRAKNEKRANSSAKKRDRLLEQAADLEARATGTEGSESLGEDTPSLFVRAAGGWIQLLEISSTQARGTVIVPLGSDINSHAEWRLLASDLPPSARKVSDTQIVVLEHLKDQGAVDTVFNWRFFTSGDSREPELAGIWGAVVGSFWTMIVTFLLAFPIGVMAAIYLEEFAPKNRMTDFVEVNINNLAAVPSIVFGLLGLAAILPLMNFVAGQSLRSAPLIGGVVLALMTLPTIIIAARAAIKAVPPSIRDAALGVGASRLQTTFHHVLPLAMPGILTGTIIGMAQALGETAPLIMIGMVAFIVDIPSGVTDSASVLPVQVFRWSDFPERAFEARTGAAICVLLLFLAVMNIIAILLRRRFERRW